MLADLDCILFDLDGTLVDTAPDMTAACNALRSEEGLEPLAAELLRPHVSRGAAGIIVVGMPPASEDQRELWRERFLALYRERLTDASRPFDGMTEVLAAIEASRRCWGVVTNKPGWLAQPLLEALGLLQRACSLVAGDTLAERKPHPAPLLHAAEHCAVAPARCLYVGDDVRDMIASRSAGMRSAAALWGYIPDDQDPTAWGAHHALTEPRELLPLLTRRRA